MIYFFGYGADKNADMMEAIIGRKPKGEKATISGFQLCVQSLADVPFAAQKIIKRSWNEDDHFKSYVIRPAKDMDTIVSGTMWELSPLERNLIDNWELTGLWYNVFLMNINAPRKIQVELQVINDQPIRYITNGKRYKTFLNSRQKMIDAANRCRIDYLKAN